MLKELVDKYYLKENYNCGECLLHAANDYYHLHLNEYSMRLVSGFGAGMGCANNCGALSAAVSVLSMLFCDGKAHETEGFMDVCAEFTDAFIKELGHDNCGELKKLYRYPDDDAENRRCLLTIEKAADLLEKFIADKNVISIETAETEAQPVSADEIKRVKGMGFLHHKGTPNLFNARVITGNGKITATQSRCIAEAAEIYAGGEIAMTTRLTQEVIGVPYEKIPEFQAYLAKEGLTTGGTGPKVRPVVSCKGATCQYGLINSYELSDKLHHLFYEGYRGVTLPHKFKIAVGGCPNNCVKPSLNDIGIFGQRIPQADPDLCRNCKKCQIEAACPIKNAKVIDGKISLNPDGCINCGRCVGKCPFHATDKHTDGYAVVIGGRWGKKVAQGQRLPKILSSEEEAIAMVEKTILFFKERGIAGERLSDTVARIGFEETCSVLLSDDILSRKEQILNS